MTVDETSRAAVEEASKASVRGAAPPFRPKRGETPGASKVLRDAVGAAAIAAAETQPEVLLLKLFFFFFTHVLLEHIANCTNAHATARVVRAKEGGRWIERAPRPGTDHASAVRPRRANYTPLTVPECQS